MKEIVQTFGLSALLAIPVIAAPIDLRLVSDDGAVAIEFHTGDSADLMSYQLERSEDLELWKSYGPPVRSAAADQRISRTIEGAEEYTFYRLRVDEATGLPALGAMGEEVFGYGDLFDEALRGIGQITPEQFAERHPLPAPYPAELGWDPTTADFWPAFNADPATYNVGLIPGVDDLRHFDFRLNAEELALFKKNGFVVSERLGAFSCGEIYSRLWIDDLPVFITADSILHAWHRSYDMMIAEIEIDVLIPRLKTILDAMAGQITAAEAEINPVLRESLLDADYFITVARSLLAGSTVPSLLGQDARVQTAIGKVWGEQLDTCFDLFGAPRGVDFSQFKPRGRYGEHRFGVGFQNYFRTMMWLNRIDLRIAGGPYRDSTCAPPQMAPPRELGTSIILHWLLREAGMLDEWLESERILQAFVGWSDSMTPPQLGELLVQAGIQNLSDLADAADLQSLQDQIANGELGLQSISSDFFISPHGGPPAVLPRSFTFFGQKFVLDSWALSQVVADRIIWVEKGATNKVQRRVPSALDVAFSVLGNDHIVPDLVNRMTTVSPEYPSRVRDGLNYQHNLAAVREVVDQHPPSAWTRNVYMGWLDALRQLSPAAAADSRMPAAMQTRAWAMKDLNTQLASWTQLRHDTILYAKQSYTGTLICSYPKGMVEPRPELWRVMRDMAGRLAALDLAPVQVEFLRHFSNVCGDLLRLAEKQLRNEPYTDDDHDFISTTLVGFRGYVGRWTIRDGWYPRLFYPSRYAAVDPLSGETFDTLFGAVAWDPLVVDVHTNPPCEVCDDPGSVLHQGLGNINLLMIAVDNGEERCVYAGPVMSHYEFTVPGEPQRLTDTDWRIRLAKAGLVDLTVPDLRMFSANDWSGVPEPPEWTREFLVPQPR